MDIPYTVTARPDTGLYNAKVGIWLFLASEVMLFGGLFSAYIFLRVGADYHWPIHELNVQLGFINTVVLIASSVTVVMAWAFLKLRKFGMYQLMMAITVICAAIFMVNKTLEYKAKFEHYSVKLTDGTILTGHLEHGYFVHFKDINKLTLNVHLETAAIDADPVDYVLPYVEGESPKFKTEAGDEIELNAATFAKLRSDAIDAMREENKSKQFQRDWTGTKNIVLTAVSPLKLKLPASSFFSYSETNVTLRDGTIAEGKLEDDRMTLDVDGIDVRSVADAEKSMAWEADYLPAFKPVFIATRDHHQNEFKEKYPSRDPSKSATLQTESYFIKIHSAKADENMPGHEGGHSAEAHEPEAAAGHDAAEAGGHEGGHHPVVVLKKKDIAFFSNFTPKLNTYYAIYFTLTGLHGLHVVFGALVLLYFLVFNGKMMREDPEHLANRVEVGGLFWHFVDLVWIFLFPLLYLL